MGLDIKKLSLIVALILMHLAERGKLGKIPEIAYELRRIRKSVEEVKHEVEGLRELIFSEKFFRLIFYTQIFRHNNQ